jgi:predicted HTH transcriptional regulator
MSLLEDYFETYLPYSRGLSRNTIESYKQSFMLLLRFMAGLLMFGKGLSIREKFDNILMDFRDESGLSGDMRWSDRVTYDGTWENNLFNFFAIVTRKLTADLKKPFKLDNETRIDDTSVHKAVREGFVNLIIHSDYMMDAGVLKIIKRDDGFEFTNPGVLKLPIDEIYIGGNSKARNPRMQTMLRMVGFGDNAGSGFPAILETWKNNGWKTPELVENTVLNQVTLSLSFVKATTKSSDKKSATKIGDKNRR